MEKKTVRDIDVKGKKVACIVSGGNMDVDTMATELEHGLIMRDRLFAVTVILSDNPGALAKLTATISEQKGNVVNIEHVHIIILIIPYSPEGKAILFFF